MMWAVYLLIFCLARQASAWIQHRPPTPSSARVLSRQSSSLLYATTNGATSSSSYKHGLAILAMPYTSLDKIANEAILETALTCGVVGSKLDIVVRSDDVRASSHSLPKLRQYVGELYSALWDCEMGSLRPEQVLDAVLYVQNLPNAAPEQWLHHVPDLDYIVSHDSICGWTSEGSSGRGSQYQNSAGQGGLDAYVAAINDDRASRDLSPVAAVHVHPWPKGASLPFLQENHINYLDDDTFDMESSSAAQEEASSSSFLGGAVIPQKSLYSSVCVGGTFDGMHHGHRKLLTLAVSSVQPNTGKLLVGVTVDSMLQHKKYASLIPSQQERVKSVRDFLHRLAPGMKNRIRIVVIEDAFGPPGKEPDFEALVLSHETLDTGHYLNQHRVKLGYKPLQLLCTRRTEPHGMSSTSLRRLRAQKEERENISIQN